MKLVPTEYIVEFLTSFGCERWQKFGQDRIYLTNDVIHALLDISVDYNNTGNISSFERYGKQLSHEEGWVILEELKTSFFFDIPTATYNSKHRSKYADEIFNRLTSKIEAKYEEEN